MPSFYRCLAASLLVMALSTAALAKSEPPPIDAFFGHVKEMRHTLSPSGKYVAYLNRHPNGYALAITDLDAAEVVHETLLSKGRPRSLHWLSERRLMFEKDGKVWAINADGSDARVLIDHMHGETGRRVSRSNWRKNFRYWYVVSTLPDDRDNILVMSVNSKSQTSIHKVDVYSGEKTDLYDGVRLNVNYWYLNEAGRVVVATRTRKDRRTFYSYDSVKHELVPLSASSTSVDLSYDGEGYLDKRYRVLGAGPTPDELYIAENVSSGKFALALYNFRTGAMETLLSDPDYDVGDENVGFRLYWNEDTNALRGIGYVRDRWTSVFFDDEYKALQAKLDERYPGKVNVILDATDDLGRVLFLSEDNRSRARMIVYRADTSKMVVLTKPELDPWYAQSDIVRYESAPGVWIEGYLHTPTEPAELTPLIVLPHGGPYARTEYEFNPYVQFFVSRGYMVLEPNFRGSAGYGRDHLLGGKGGLHTTMIDDIAAGARWAISEAGADPSRTYIFGFSYGGYAAAISAIRYPDLYAAAVSYAAPLDLRKQLKWYEDEEHHFALEFWKDLLQLDQLSRAEFRELSPIHFVDDIGIPLHLYHGDRDGVVPVDHARALERQLKTQPNPNVKLRFLKDERHGVGLISNKIYLAERTLELFERSSKE